MGAFLSRASVHVWKTLFLIGGRVDVKIARSLYPVKKHV
jgi:hypothetical protein